MWVFEPEPNPTKVVCGKISSKRMVDGFFCNADHVATVPLEHRRTVNSDLYTRTKEDLKRRIVVHYDKASSHTSAQISALLSGQNVELMSHLLYSPDLAPNDLSLFSHIKKKMRGQRFSSPDDTVQKRSKTMFSRYRNRNRKKKMVVH